MTDDRQESRGPRLGVVLPLANEEASIDDLVRRILAQLDGRDRVHCVLDHVSRDRTRARVEAWCARDARVTLVWAPDNRSVVDAYFAGYRAAYDSGCRWILEMDAGFNHRPEQIPQFLDGMRRGYEFVGGSRYLPTGEHRSPWTRVVISRGGTMLTRWLLGARMTDMTSGFECFSRSAMKAVLDHGVASRANFFQTEIRMLMHRFRWLEVPIRYENPNYTLGRSSVREALRVLWKLRRERRQAAPA